MSWKFRFVLLALLLRSPLYAQEFSSQPVLENLSDNLAEMRELLDEKENAAESTLFTRGKEDVQEDLNDYLDEALEFLVSEAYPNARERIIGLDAEMLILQARLNEMQVELIDAQPSSEVEGLVDKVLLREFASGSSEWLTREIGATQENIQENKDLQTRIVKEFSSTLSEQYGIDINREEARSLLYQVNGSSIVESLVFFKTLKIIENRIGEIRSTSPGDAVMRKYYGLAAILRLVAARLHAVHLEQYDSKWLPSVEALYQEHRELIEETEFALDGATNSQRRLIYENNLKIQEDIAEVIDDYRDMLQKRRDLTRERLREVELDAAVAINTLKTLESAAILFEQFISNSAEFEALSKVRTDDLIPLDDSEIFEHYLDISRKLAEG